MKLLYLLILVFGLNTGANYYQASVYLCDSAGGKKYHLTKNCRGLSNCRHEVVKVTLKKAQSLGKTHCGHED